MGDFAHQMRWLADEAYTKAEKIRVVLDNLNLRRCTKPDPAEARRILKRLEFHYTPKHGSWLNMAEIELSVFSLSQSEDTRWGYPHPRTGSPGETPQ